MTIEPKIIFGKRVRALREQIGLTQDELAERAGISGNYIGKIERGVFSPSLDTIYKIAHGLGVRAEILVKDYSYEDPEISTGYDHFLKLSEKHRNTLLRLIDDYYEQDS